MRIWSIDILKFLPDLQFRGQLREMMLILHQWRDEGKTNHLLINKIMEYPKNDFVRYFLRYEAIYHERYGNWLPKQWEEFKAFDDTPPDERSEGCFDGWHNREYLRICMSNLFEKHKYGVGKSRITDDEWKHLCDGYEEITGEKYEI